MSNNKPDLIVINGGGSPDAFAAIAVANVAYEAAASNREISLIRTKRQGHRNKSNSFVNYFVQDPALLPYSEAQKHFRYVFGYNNQRSTQVIMQEAAKSSMVFFFGYCLIESEMEQLLEINPNVYVFDYHSNRISPALANRLSLYQYDENKCAAQFAWDFFVPNHSGCYPALVAESAFSLFNNTDRGRELFFGFIACPFQSTEWVRLLGTEMQSGIKTILQRGQFFIDYHRVLQSQMLDSATIVRMEGKKAIQKQTLTKNERSGNELVIYMIQCPTPAAHYLIRCMKDLPIAKRSIIITYNHHIRERAYHYLVSSNIKDLEVMDIVGYTYSDPQCASRNGAYLKDYGWFTNNVKPQALLNALVNRMSTMTSDPV